jgi:outer membrane protein assembly factor BamB
MKPAAIASMLAFCHSVHADDWTHFARGPSRVSASSTAVSISTARWVSSVDDLGRPITFLGQSGPVTLGSRVFARGYSGGESRVFAFDRAAGTGLWNAAVPAPVLESWASPAADADNGTILIADGNALTALDAATGELRWQTTFSRPLVSCSPLVVADLHPRGRAFVTDYDGFGGGGRIHCINVDPFHPALNPHQPGEVVWSAPIGGSSGNTVAHAKGVVYVASAADEGGFPPGRILAFPANADATPVPLWVTPNPQPLGFFGGVAVTSGAVYAASYNFTGGLMSANLVKLNAADGSLRWSVPCNRTATTPVPAPGGLVALGGGIRGFGTVPSVQLFRDDGNSAQRLWDSALDSWIDANANGVMDPGEYLAVGGWTLEPVVASGRLLVGLLPPGSSVTSAPVDLYQLDLARVPSEPAFVAAHYSGAGGSVAVADGWAFTIGPAGLTAFAPPCPVDCNGDGALNLADFGCFQTRFAQGDPYADCNGDGVLNLADFGCFQTRFAQGCP